MTATVGRLVLPGDDIAMNSEAGVGDGGAKHHEGPRRIDLGPGLQRLPGGAVCRALEPGVYQWRPPRLHWLDTCWRRYVPVRGHCVIGQVVARAGDTLRVDIGAHTAAGLSLLAFEGATRTNRPPVQVGDLVLARLVAGGAHCEPELVCVNSRGKADGLGVLAPRASGCCAVTVWRVPLLVCRRLLAPDCRLLPLLAKRLRFELAVGLNGRVWLCGENVRQTLCLLESLQQYIGLEVGQDTVPLSQQPTASDAKSVSVNPQPVSIKSEVELIE